MTRASQAWGRPRPTSIEMTCPVCGRKFVSAIWTTVSTDGDPVRALDLITDEAHQMTCPDCGFTHENTLPCLYLDTVNNACIFLVYSEEMAQRVYEMFVKGEISIERIDGKEPRKRIVIGRRDFFSTALAFSKGLDDRVMEILKIDLLKVLIEEDGVLSDDDQIEYYNLMQVTDDTLYFDIGTGTGRIEVTTSMEAYRIIEEQFGKSSLANLQNYTVELNWGLYGYRVLIREGLL